MKAADIEKDVKKALGKAVTESRIQGRNFHKRHKHESIWFRIKKEALRDAVEKMFDYGTPYLAVISGTDLGDNVELLYHFNIGSGEPQGEVTCTFAIPIDKKDMTVPTITDLIPGAILTEREKQEFFGIKVIGIPDTRRAFLADDLAGCHPWIKDDPGTKKMERHAHERGVTE